tara:strand:+ start:364 stop:606 length:243 start_codon:yes stop_codon:yes gene_type:complete
MKTPKEFTEEYTNLTANGIKPSLLYLEEQVYKLMQAYVDYVKVNNVVLDDVICCECSDNFSTPEVELNKCFSCGKKLHCN